MTESDYFSYKNRGICPNCKRREIVPGRSMCGYCAEAFNTTLQKRRKSAKKSGICATCCKNPAKPGRVTCQSCLTKREARKKVVNALS